MRSDDPRVPEDRDAPPDIRAGDYRAARIGAAAALVGVLAVLLVADVLSHDYELQPFTVTALLVSILTLLGLEAGSILKTRR